MSSTIIAITRLRRELELIIKEPIPNFVARPNPDNFFEWHFLLYGPKDSPYEGGEYYGKIIFPNEYPHKPPSIIIITPSGRFQTQTPICLSFTNYHPSTWNPMWSVRSILIGFLSFMLEEAQTTGSIVTSTIEKIEFANQSITFNNRIDTISKIFKKDLLKQRAQYLYNNNNNTDSKTNRKNQKSKSKSKSNTQMNLNSNIVKNQSNNQKIYLNNTSNSNLFRFNFTNLIAVFIIIVAIFLYFFLNY
eukprot:TRINITY_DN198_c1_g1_i1.p2 TRINITY_DN198_c1_g1~~TRINITY_DN198_c1_g1_i1.p2  ORF type:complete len:247 (+),score=75.61 TRINITY_DN198_c1_g1_i1:1128-1868(+)